MRPLMTSPWCSEGLACCSSLKQAETQLDSRCCAKILKLLRPKDRAINHSVLQQLFSYLYDIKSLPPSPLCPHDLQQKHPTPFLQMKSLRTAAVQTSKQMRGQSNIQNIGAYLILAFAPRRCCNVSFPPFSGTQHLEKLTQGLIRLSFF